jgi:hypothetical protein
MKRDLMTFMTWRELWMIIHGMGFGSVFLLAFTGTTIGFYSLQRGMVTVEGVNFWLGKIKVGLWVMAFIAWATVISGTFIIFPWYRAVPPSGTTNLSEFPRYFLMANPTLVQWQNIGMDWKEIVGWVTPIAATVVAYIFHIYGATLMSNAKIRSAMLEFFVVAFATAGVAGFFGALITKIVPLH